MSKKTSTTVTATVRFRLPPGANVAQALQYVRDAIKSHCGGMDPTNPMFELERQEVVVSLKKRETIYL